MVWRKFQRVYENGLSVKIDIFKFLSCLNEFNCQTVFIYQTVDEKMSLQLSYIVLMLYLLIIITKARKKILDSYKIRAHLRFVKLHISMAVLKNRNHTECH